MNILIDYLVMSFKIHCKDIIFKKLNLDPEKFIEIRSFYGYPKCMYYEGVKIHWRCVDGVVSEVCLDCSGKGCRYIEQANNRSFDWFGFLSCWDTLIRSKDAHISRLDVACDDVDGLTDICQVKRYTRSGKFVSRAKDWMVIDGSSESSVYFGSPQSDRRLRIYDKALEQGIDGGMAWLRYEFQLRNDNATSYYLNWCECRDVGRLFGGVMIDFLRFVDVASGSDAEVLKVNRHQERLVTTPWWERFVDTAERIPQLYLPGTEYTLDALREYLRRQANSSAKAYIIAQGGEVGEYLEDVKRSALNERQRKLLAQLGVAEKDFNI